jgi:hypothetical protein
MDAVALLRRAQNAELSVEPGDKLVVRGPRNAESVVKLFAEHKAEVLTALANTVHEIEPLSSTPWFPGLIRPVEDEPSVQVRRGRVRRLEGAVVLHFCCECRAWGTFGYGVNLRAGRLVRWYCAAHRPQGCAP